MAYKYEEEINARIAKYDWKSVVEVFTWDDEISQASLDTIYRDFRAPLSANARYALEHHYVYDKNGVHKKEEVVEDELPVLEIECSKTDCLPKKEGVYFLGMIGTNPDGKNYYLIKVGRANNISTRVRGYATYNPMLYIGGYYETKDSEKAERMCHYYLTQYAYAKAQNAKEWFYVTETVYYKLCDAFGNPKVFEVIAKGVRNDKI